MILAFPLDFRAKRRLYEQGKIFLSEITHEELKQIFYEDVGAIVEKRLFYIQYSEFEND